MANEASARWDGSIKGGSGEFELGGGACSGQFSFKSRFEDGTGTNPEELIAAAHASCFSMALSLILGEGGNEPESIETEATVRVRNQGGEVKIDRIDLQTTGRVPGLDADGFQQAAEAAKENCPVSKALAGVDEVNLRAELAS